VTLDDHNVVQPDAFFISPERAGIRQGGWIVGAPDPCVEILSPDTERADRLFKLDLYARFGVAHYWTVDRRARTIEEYVPDGDAYRVRGLIRFDETFRPAALPGFEFTLNVVPLPLGL
jgi:Uma2 family endonuclease